MGIGKRAAAAAVATIMGASALLAGGSTATAAPAPSVSGKALLSWGTKCPSMSTSLKAVAPAANYGARLGLPVTSATGREIRLGGAIQASVNGQAGAVFQDPKISIAGTNAGRFIVSAPGGTGALVTAAIFNIANFRKVAKDAKTREWSGVLQAPIKDTPVAPAMAIAQLLSGLCGAQIAPGDTVGSITVTVKSS